MRNQKTNNNRLASRVNSKLAQNQSTSKVSSSASRIAKPRTTTQTAKVTPLRPKASKVTRPVTPKKKTSFLKDKFGKKTSKITEKVEVVKETTSKVKEKVLRDKELEALERAKQDVLDNEEILEIEELQRIREDKVKEHRAYVARRVGNAALIILCVYMVFLIYGVSVTNYQYNDNGTISAQKLSVSDIREKTNYETVMVQYENARILYENTLMLDYRLGQGQEDPMTIATEYEGLLDDVSNLSIKTDAMVVDTKYNQVKNLLLSWIRNDIAVYLQNMSAAISQNDATTANNALQDKDRVYANFSTVTQNVVSTGQDLVGVDITNIKEWTPEKYINEAINGVEE